MSAGPYEQDRRYIKRRTSRFERRVYCIRRLLLPFSELELRFLFSQTSEDKWYFEGREEIHYGKVGNFLFLLFRTFWHGRGCGSKSTSITNSALRMIHNRDYINVGQLNSAVYSREFVQDP